MDRASLAAYALPSLARVNVNVASATEGAAPKSPAKLLGLNTPPRIANPETTAPPITNRKRISFMVSHSLVVQTAALHRLLDLTSFRAAARPFTPRMRYSLPESL